MKNVHIFEEEEENKLEYTSVFESYVHIMEQLIEHKLKEKFSEEEVAAFFQDFTENCKNYEQFDKDTVQTLFDFVDFTSFKKSMIDYKKLTNTTEKNVDAAENENVDLKKAEEFFWQMHGNQDGWSKKTSF